MRLRGLICHNTFKKLLKKQTLKTPPLKIGGEILLLAVMQVSRSIGSSMTCSKILKQEINCSRGGVELSSSYFYRVRSFNIEIGSS